MSHHPPISACHASSPDFEFWQDIRIKTKFWGKSMEFQPLGDFILFLSFLFGSLSSNHLSFLFFSWKTNIAGTVNVRLLKHDDHYRWNKVTTCVHNLFGGQRWVDQYGELIITSDRGIRCKLNFAKASYWSSNRYEVAGTVTDENNRVVHHLFGKFLVFF